MDGVISCKQLVEFAFDYLDGTLPQGDQVAFRRHLALCPDCVVFFETYRKTPQISRDALEQGMTAQVRDSIHNFLRSRK